MRIITRHTALLLGITALIAAVRCSRTNEQLLQRYIAQDNAERLQSITTDHFTVKALLMTPERYAVNLASNGVPGMLNGKAEQEGMFRKGVFVALTFELSDTLAAYALMNTAIRERLDKHVELTCIDKDGNDVPPLQMTESSMKTADWKEEYMVILPEPGAKIRLHLKKYRGMFVDVHFTWKSSLRTGKPVPKLRQQT